MDLSLFYFAADSDHDDAAARYDLLLSGARFADVHGLAAVWTPERHFHPFGGNYPNPAVAAAAIAMVTERVAIRAGSVVAPLHHPARIAEEWSIVDNLSGGRVGISFASGWHGGDFVLRPENQAKRHQVMYETIETVQRLWRGETVAMPHGTDETDVRVYPRPVQPELPTWVTAAGNVETFRSAGRIGAGLLTHLLDQDVDELAAKIRAYRQELASSSAGWPGHVAVMLHTYVTPPGVDTEEVVREPMYRYLRSSLGLLVAGLPKAQRPAPGVPMRPELVDLLVSRSFDRIYHERSLLGEPAKCRLLVEALRDAGVDEIACLVDFGLPNRLVLEGLEQIASLSADLGSSR